MTRSGNVELNYRGCYAGESTVQCPCCGGEYNHHSRVEIYQRTGGEDGPTMVLTSALPEWTETEVNPSARRDAVRIHFWCENEHYWWMDVVQHKGVTIVSANWDESE